MSNKKVYRLTESRVFCMNTWMHIHTMPNGDILPCCVSKWGAPMGNLYKDTIENIWNGSEYKTVRSNMLNEIPVDSCDRCYKEEEWGNKHSYRRIINNRYAHLYDSLVEQATDATGFTNKMEFRRWDFRFSNLCNLACTMCSPSCSSKWVDIENKMFLKNDEVKFKTSNQDLELFINTIKSQSNIVDDIYFAGGEPLIQPEHYEILKHIDNVGRVDKINFTYSTNLTSLKYKSTNVIDYWNKMQRVKLQISLDEVDADRLYYIRYPAQLDEIVNNIRQVNENFTDSLHKWVITPTWNLMNTHRIKEIVGFFKDNNLLPQMFYTSSEWENDLHNIILQYPDHMSISAASLSWKSELRTKLTEYKQWYLDEMIPLKQPHVRMQATQVFLSSIDRFFNALNDSTRIDPGVYKDWYSRLDRVRETSFVKTFPELAWHLE